MATHAFSQFCNLSNLWANSLRLGGNRTFGLSITEQASGADGVLTVGEAVAPNVPYINLPSSATFLGVTPWGDPVLLQSGTGDLLLASNHYEIEGRYFAFDDADTHTIGGDVQIGDATDEVARVNWKPGLFNALGGNDFDSGTDFSDALVGGLGDDTVHGHGADDHGRGGAENDAVAGGIGNDTLSGGWGADTLVLVAGAPILWCWRQMSPKTRSPTSRAASAPCISTRASGTAR